MTMEEHIKDTHLYIYKITNNLNGKTYIGQHKSNLKDDNYFGSGTVIKQAIKKYGKENFTKTIIQECLTQEELNKAEIQWIKKEKSIGKAEYNIAGGGQKCSNPFQYKTEEEKRKIYNKSGKSRKGRPSGSSGKRFKKFDTGFHKAIQQPCKSRRSIQCLETGQIFKSIRECSDILKISHEAIKDYLDNGRTTPIGGYTFKEIKLKIPYVIILENEQTFETIMDCANFIGCDRTNVIKNIKKKTKQCSGYHIVYFSEYDKNNNPYLGLPRYNESKQKYTTKKGHSVKCIELNKTFKSLAEAERETGANFTNISMCCTGIRKTAGGYHWKYSE